jgi:hypothetical protein
MIIYGEKNTILKSKEELVEILKEYKKILNGETINYLEKMLNLNVIATSPTIDNETLNILSDTSIYRDIATYNIHSVALNTFDDNVKIVDGENFSASVNFDRNYNIFNFDYRKTLNEGHRMVFSKNHDKSNIGIISLYKYVDDKNIREEEALNILNKIHELMDKKNPYHDIEGYYGGPGSRWAFENSQKIKNLQKKYEVLDSKKELSDSEKKAVEFISKYYDKLISNFGLKDEEFEKVERINNYDIFDSTMSSSSIQFVKKLPRLTIYNNKEYL